ncbi:hypothetical protein CBNA_1704 [Coxiella burnetii str. Namibia]|nr:hypothetical protein CBNA_1704 [Coxiella burnetii str. Namibia]
MNLINCFSCWASQAQPNLRAFKRDYLSDQLVLASASLNFKFQLK